MVVGNPEPTPKGDLHFVTRFVSIPNTIGPERWYTCRRKGINGNLLRADPPQLALLLLLDVVDRERRSSRAGLPADVLGDCNCWINPFVDAEGFF